MWSSVVVKVEFSELPHGVKVIETFDTENQNREKVQREDWQGILNNFKKYVRVVINTNYNKG